MSFLCSYTKIYPGLEFGNELITIYYNKVFCLSLGDMDMKKMNSPKLEVIQFNTEDVIVTSSKYSSLNPFLTYFTWGKEINEFLKNSDRANKRYNLFSYDSTSGTFNLSQSDLGNEASLMKRDSFDYPYAWYDDGWFTQNLLRDDYKIGDGVYRWRYDNTN